jgi:twitching motility two-component system response regulator PilG
LSEEEPGVYEISEEVLEETGGSLGHIEESGTISIPPEFLAPSQRGPRPGVYEAVPEEVNPPRSFLLTEEAPSAPTGTEEKEVLSVLEPPQIEPQPERVEADESVVIDFYSPPEEALPYEVSSEEAESKATQEASREEPPQGGSRYPGDSHPTAAAPHLAKEPMREGYMGTVMVVDDSPTVQKIVTITLEREGYRVVGVDNAMQALARFEELVPDVILLDINLPYIDGYQLCKIIKGNPLTKNASVIMLTGKDGFFDKVRGKLAGAAEYITKPFQPSHLIETVRRHTRGRL